MKILAPSTDVQGDLIGTNAAGSRPCPTGPTAFSSAQPTTRSAAPAGGAKRDLRQRRKRRRVLRRRHEATWSRATTSARTSPAPRSWATRSTACSSRTGNLLGRDGEINVISGNGRSGVAIFNASFNNVYRNSSARRPTASVRWATRNGRGRQRRHAEPHRLARSFAGQHDRIQRAGRRERRRRIARCPILLNSIFANGGLGIDLNDDGVSAPTTPAMPTPARTTCRIIPCSLQYRPVSARPP